MSKLEFIERVVSIANENRHRITTDLGSVKRICDPAEIVFAVWPDAKKLGGVDMLIVKGEMVMSFIAGSGVAEELVVEAIPCMCSDQARALKQMLKNREAA